MRKIILTIEIIFLFILSAVTPFSYGKNINILDDKRFEQIDNLNFCFYHQNQQSSKISIYQEHLKQDYLNVGVERVEQTISLDSFEKEVSLGPMNSAWPMQSHDLHHTGRSPYSTNDNPGDLKWKFKTDDWVEDSIIIDNNGVIYFGDLDYYLYALYPNGTLKWKFRTEGWILGSSPAINEDCTIYVGSWDTKLYAINPDGTLKWSVGTGGSIASSPIIGEDGTIYLGHMDNNIVAVNPNGTIKWSYPTGYKIAGGPAIGDDGTIYCGSGDTYFYALNPNGTLKWRYKTEHYIKGPPSIADDGTIYVGSYDDYLYALYPNGTMNWKCNIGTGSETNPSIASDGTIYVGSPDGHLYAVYPNGTLKWSFVVIGNIHQSSPAISEDGTIYFGTDDSGYIYAVNPDGTERWCKKIAQNWVESSPSIAEDGTVYIGSSYDQGGGYLYAFGVKELVADADGPYYGIINEPMQFTGSSSGGYSPHSYHWDFGDTQTSEEQNPTHTYNSAGNFTVTLTVTDNTSNTSTDTTWAWIQENNTPPNKPKIDGPTNGNAGTPYPYNVSTSDPDNNIIWYYIDWGDNTNSGWIGPFDSGTEITRSHSWNKKGTYIIKVKAKDPYNEESLETTLEVTIPRNKASYYNSFFMRFLERFPLLQKILSF